VKEMVSVQMYWGSSWIPSGIPFGLNVEYNPTTGRGLQVSGEVVGPGCGDWSCGQYWVNLTYMGSFHLSTSRMPERGCVFNSSPEVHFSGSLVGETEEGSNAIGFVFDDSSAKCGVRIRQRIYSGVYQIGMRTLALQRVINIDDDNHEIEIYDMPAVLTVPTFSWILNRTRHLQIDIEVRFRMYLEGTGSIRFSGNPFIFNVTQWSIWAEDA
jgi:hypothetical protein